MKLLETLTFSERRVLSIPTSLHCCNPSLVRQQDEWKVLIRALDPEPWAGNHGGLSTENWLLELDDKFNIKNSVKVDDQNIRSQHAELVNGLEDGRIFFWNDELWGLFSGFRRNQKTFFNTMVLVRYHQGEWVDPVLLSSPTGATREKNWMPCVMGQSLFLVYSVDPLRVYQYIDGKLVPIDRIWGQYPQNSTASLAGSMISGSSTLVPWGDGFLAVVHHRRKVTGIRKLVMKYWNPDQDYQLRKVLFDHYLIHFDCRFNVVRRSLPFSFEFDGVEFCSGLHIGGDRVFMSYGVKDRIPVVLETNFDELQAVVGWDERGNRVGRG